MTITSIIQSVINSMNEDISIINDLINGLQAVTIESDDPNTPAPTVDSNDVWTLSQDTADTDGVYKGIYTFALNTACSIINISSVTGHSPPASTFPSAR